MIYTNRLFTGTVFSIYTIYLFLKTLYLLTASMVYLYWYNFTLLTYVFKDWKRLIENHVETPTIFLNWTSFCIYLYRLYQSKLELCTLKNTVFLWYMVATFPWYWHNLAGQVLWPFEIRVAEYHFLGIPGKSVQYFVPKLWTATIGPTMLVNMIFFLNKVKENRKVHT